MAGVLIAGCGYLGERLGRILLDRGRRPCCVRRDARSLAQELRGVSADLYDARAVAELPFPFEAIVYTVAADASTPEAYRKAYLDGPLTLLRRANRQSVPPRFIFASSTSIYGEDAGGWVDETTEPGPVGFRGEIVLEGETALRQESPSTTSIRFGGIYGPGRTRMIETARREPSLGGEPDRFTNRIHADDAARALAHLLALEQPEPIYLGVDAEPALRSEVIAWLRKQIDVDDCAERPGARAQVRGKRCDGTRLLGSGFELRFPTYREGYGALLRP